MCLHARAGFNVDVEQAKCLVAEIAADLFNAVGAGQCMQRFQIAGFNVAGLNNKVVSRHSDVINRRARAVSA